MRWSYRAGQFWLRLAARWRAVDDTPARQILSAEAYRLFAALPPAEKLHALNVWRVVHREGASSTLEWAALLHDVGKLGGGLTLAHRVLSVLLERLDHRLLVCLASSRTGLGRPFYVQLHHAALGAERCAQVGCPARVIDLVRYHDRSTMDAVHDPLLRAELTCLQRADEQC